jgi:hypothetical protein
LTLNDKIWKLVEVFTSNINQSIIIYDKIIAKQNSFPQWGIIQKISLIYKQKARVWADNIKTSVLKLTVKINYKRSKCVKPYST